MPKRIIKKAKKKEVKAKKKPEKKEEKIDFQDTKNSKNFGAPKSLDFNGIENKWQSAWEKAKIFEAEPDNKKEKFFFTTPYPYISGSLHLGHGRAVVESDVYCRFKRMLGFNVLFPLSFHITGTPVLGISAAIKNGDKDKIEMYENYVSAYIKDKKEIKKIVRSFEDPRKIVEFFIPKMIGEYKQLGLGIDWRRSFTSGDFEHQQMVTWQFNKYKEKNFLVKDKYPVLYSPSDESAMGEDDIQDADSNPVEKQEFTLLKFKLKNGKYLVAATLRPETVFGQTNLWINPEIDYYEAQVGKETWILSKEALFKLKYQKDNVKELGKTKEKLLGMHATAPAINRQIIILPSTFVDADVGTGIVTSVPSDAPYDYIALKEIQDSKDLDERYGFSVDQMEEIEDIEVIPIIKTEKYGNLAGVKVVEDNRIINQEDKLLEKLTQEVYKEGFHTGILLENCGKYAGMKIIEAKEKMKADLIKKGEADIFHETSRKALSRSGGKIIVAVLDNQWFLDFNAPGWKDKARECLKKIVLVPEGNRKQFEDVFEWLDKRPCARRRGLGTQFPFDKEWIIESLSDSTIYMTLYTISNIIKKYKLNKENLNYEFFEYVYLGKSNVKDVARKIKVSEKILEECRKSFEYWMPNDQRHTFILHLSNHLSFMIFAFAGIFAEKYWPKKITFHGLVVSEGEKMSKSKGNVITLLHVKQNYGADVFRFYLTQSANITGTFDWRELEAENAKKTITKLYEILSEVVKNRKKGEIKPIYLHKFNKIVKEATEKINEMKLREFNNLVIYDMLNIIRDAKITLNEKELYAFYEYIAKDWVKLLAPVCPHISEDIWHKLGNKSFVSKEKWPTYDKTKINEELEKQEQQITSVIEDIKNIMKIMKEKQNKETKKAYLYVIPKELEIYKPVRQLIEKSFNIQAEIFAVNDSKKYDPQNKAQKAKFGKPAIYLE